MVQTNTVQGPGGEAGVMRVKGTKRGLAMALDGNGRWCWLDPKRGAKLAVAEAARKVACTGAVPVAATNCLNFGNPEKPEIMAQLSAAIDGIAEACTALGTPITGGNVSLYNETKGEGIYPTPVIGVVGILEDVSKAVPADFQREGDSVVVLVPPRADRNLPPINSNADAIDLLNKYMKARMQEFGSSAFVFAHRHNMWGTAPTINLDSEAVLNLFLARLSDRKLINSARDISDGGIAVAIAESSFSKGFGAAVRIGPSPGPIGELISLFGEDESMVIVTCSPEKIDEIRKLAVPYQIWVNLIGSTTKGRVRIALSDTVVIDTPVQSLKSVWANALQATLSADTVTA
jgi:phosphoribosylformylglycinamidine synthase